MNYMMSYWNGNKIKVNLLQTDKAKAYRFTKSMPMMLFLDVYETEEGEFYGKYHR